MRPLANLGEIIESECFPIVNRKISYSTLQETNIFLYFEGNTSTEKKPPPPSPLHALLIASLILNSRSRSVTAVPSQPPFHLRAAQPQELCPLIDAASLADPPWRRRLPCTPSISQYKSFYHFPHLY